MTGRQGRQDPGELAGAREALRQREAELAAARQELEDTNQGLIALYSELEQARQASARLAAIVQWSGDAMVSMTPEGMIQTWNPGAERLFGFRQDEVIGQHPLVALVPDWLADEFVTVLKRTRERAETFETRRRHKDGSLIDVAVTVTAMRDSGGAVTGFSEVLRDISERLRTEAELATARAEQEVLADRDRMARDLHDRVIQRVFGAGMSLQTAMGMVRDRRAVAQIEAVIGQLDLSIKEIREAIYALRHGQFERRSLRAQVVSLASETAVVLGFTPAVSFEGPIDGIAPQIATQLLSVVREALSNVARHAAASAATVSLSAGSEVVVRVDDNGRGVGETTRASGLRNMRERAEMLSGSFQVTSESGAGTRLEWRVPASQQRPGR